MKNNLKPFLDIVRKALIKVLNRTVGMLRNSRWYKNI